MKKIIVLLILIAGFFAIQVPVHAQEQTAYTEPEFYRAVVIGEPIENPTTYEGPFGPALIRQEVPLRILHGPDTGTELTLDFDVKQSDLTHGRLKKSDQVIVGTQMIAQEKTYYISDIYRLNALWWLLGFFVVLILLLARSGGLRAILGLAISFGVIIWIVLPNIQNGGNTIMIAFLSTLLITTVSIFIAHGFRSRTTIAFVSTVCTILLSLGLSLFFTDIMHLFGLGSEEAFFLQGTDKTFNLRGILIAGIIIGTLGVLDDITTAQAAVVEELHLANPNFTAKELFKRGSSVGREHIISLVNTLILAYTGASLPLLLLFQIYERPTWLVLNSEIIMEEIVRMLIGSIALALAVPLTTYLAARYYARKKITVENK